MKRKVIAMVLAATLVVTMSACGSSSSDSTSTSSEGSGSSSAGEEGDPYDLQVISKGLTNSWMQVVKNGVEDAAKTINDEAGYEKVKVSYIGPDTQSDIAVQVQQVQDAVSSGCDCIGLAALDPDSVSSALTDAMNAGIPVVGWDSGIPGAPDGSVVANVATDNYAAAGEAATELYNKISSRIGTGEQVRVGVLSATSVANGHIDRGLGFIDKFAELAAADGKTICVTGNEKFVGDAKAEVVDEQSADCVIEVRVPSQMNADLLATEAGVLLNEKDLIGVFANTQDAVEGVLTSNQNLNVLGTGDDQVILMGFDAGTVAIEAVKAGTMYGGINQAPYDIGKQTVEVMTKVCDGEDVEDISTAYNFYNADNLEDEDVAANLYD